MIELDINQQKAVDTLQNVVVSAGAGSGKTRVLAERFLHLVEMGTKVDRILTLTFTNKAAVEMKERIFKTLKGTKTANAQAALKDFDKAHIQTLDSYFSDVAKSGAHYYGITPAFALDEDSIKDTIHTHALEFILENQHLPVLKEMTKLYTIDQIAEKVFASSILSYTSIVDQRDFVKDAEKQYAEIVNQWAVLTKKADEIVEEMKYALDNYKGDKKGTLALKEAFEKLKYVVGSRIKADIANLAQMNEYILFLSSILAVKAPTSKEVSTDCYNKLYKADYGSLYKTLVSCLDFVANYETAKGIAELLNIFQNNVNDTKRNAGRLTFKDIARLAFTVLKEHADIRHTEQAKFDKIMIDEFQDNDQMQCDVLFMLSDANEKFDEKGEYIIPNFDSSSDNYIQKRLKKEILFFVGDEKQSIYRFRNADVSVFRNLQEHLGKRLEMDINYRSKPNLIKSFNTLFGGDNIEGNESIFYTKENCSDIPKYEAVYEKVKVPESKEKEGDSEKRVFVSLYSDDEGADAKAQRGYQARYIAKKIRELKEKGYKYSDIALLFRASTNLNIYSKELLRANIPYSTEVYNGFYSDGPVNDLVSYLKLCAYPDDVNALVKVLHSSFVNLNLEEARALATKIKEIKREITEAGEESKETEENKSYLPFDTKAEEVAKELLGEDSESFKKFLIAKKNFADIKETLKTKSLTEVIYTLWNDLGYRFETMWNEDVSMYRSMYDILTELARQAEQSSSNLSSFIDDIEEYKDNIAKIDGLNIPQEASDSVKILTIHKSKGLEFKVVFVCDTAAEQKARSMDAVAFSKEFGLILNTPPCDVLDRLSRWDKDSERNYFYTQEQSKEAAEEKAELKRVTYVAFTRAEEMLYIVGGEIEKEKKDKKGESKDKNSIFAMIEPFVSKEDDEEKPFVQETFNKSTSSKDKNVQKFENNSKSRELFIEAEKAFFENAELAKEHKVLPLHISPSALERKNAFNHTAKEEDIPLWTLEIDRVVKDSIPKAEQEDFSPENIALAEEDDTIDEMSKGKPRFGYNTFGTIAHKFLEKKFEDENSVAEIDNSLFDGIAEEKDVEIIKGICERMAKEFEATELCKNAKEALSCKEGFLESEYKFRSRLNFTDENDEKQTIVVSGSMDLVFKNSQGHKYKYTIVDYKTDRFICEEKYIPQLSSYRFALANILDCKAEEIECVLYFLRYGKAVDISDSCSEEIAENELKKILFSYKL